MAVKDADRPDAFVPRMYLVDWRQAERFKQLCFRRGVSMSLLIRQAIDKILEEK